MRELESLFTRIIEGDATAVRPLLRAQPGLATLSIENDRYVSDVLHWFYAGDAPLHAAAAARQPKIAALLLDAGAEPHAARNHRRSAPLHYACDGHWAATRQVATIRVLLEAGADLQACDANGATPLHRAVRGRATLAVKYLLDAGADPAARNKPGSTPFHLAVQNTGKSGSGTDEARAAQRDILQLFLDRGVSPTLPDLKGKTVRDWARSPWIRQMLA